MPQPVVVEGEEEWEIKRIMNKRKVWGRDKYLVRWKRCTVKEDTWESRENLKNTMELVEEFEKDHQREGEEVRQYKEEENKQIFSRELPRRYTSKLLYRWDNKKYNWEYWK